MSKTATTNCPKCGAELTVEWWTENHKVHNGIGMQTVARDHHREITDMNCEHTLEDLDDNQLDELFSEAAESYHQSKKDYYAEQVDHLKDEGRL